MFLNYFPRGFSIFEILIALILIAVISSFAIPSYQQHIIHARRSDAKIALFNAQSQLETYYALHRTYQGAVIATKSPGGFYEVLLVEASSQHYQLEANPVEGKSQAADVGCFSFGIDDLDQKTGTCWVTVVGS